MGVAGDAWYFVWEAEQKFTNLIKLKRNLYNFQTKSHSSRRLFQLESVKCQFFEEF